MKNLFEKFKKRSGITSTADLVLILSAFSLAGPSDTLTVRPLVHSLFNAFPHLPAFVQVPVYILFTVIIYQCFLLFYGFLFGQFNYFWEREKKLGRWLRKVFTTPIGRPAEPALAKQTS